MNNNVVGSVYTDGSDIVFNLYNFSLIFASIEGESAQVLGKIKMSPETAKEFANKLMKSIEAYEEIYGEIKVRTPEIEKKEAEFKKKMMSNKQNAENAENSENSENTENAETNDNE